MASAKIARDGNFAPGKHARRDYAFSTGIVVQWMGSSSSAHGHGAASSASPCTGHAASPAASAGVSPGPTPSARATSVATTLTGYPRRTLSSVKIILIAKIHPGIASKSQPQALTNGEHVAQDHWGDGKRRTAGQNLGKNPSASQKDCSGARRFFGYRPLQSIAKLIQKGTLQSKLCTALKRKRRQVFATMPYWTRRLFNLLLVKLRVPILIQGLLPLLRIRERTNVQATKTQAEGVRLLVASPGVGL